ncbi:Aminomethyltransferase folate-binding domain-containing protein [Xylaria castorea]|nr:Aminomethyltransferase folate-binding domain-containing protein [Xylaria castorea]
MQVVSRSASRWSLRGLSPAPSSSRARATFVCASCRLLQQQHQQANVPSRRQRRTFASSAILRENTQTGPSIPSPPPSSGHARLRTRRLISISGIDAPHFLQGLITTSIEGNNNAHLNGTILQPAAQKTPWFYCGFLNALGRVLHDVFVYPVPSGSGGEPHFMIEVDAAQLTTLLKHLKRYKLRSKIFLRAIEEDEMSVWQIWNDAEEAATSSFTQEEAGGLARNDGRSVMIPDLRAPGMGYRVLTVGADWNAQALDLPSALQPAAADGKTDEAAYRVRRYLRGVPEGSAEIIPAQALPLESNMDLMGGIDFRKGCYVGQELTIRTRHRGVVRKRILPCMLYGEGSAVPTSLEYRPDAIPSVVGGDDGVDLRGLTIGRHGKKGRSTGMFLASTGNIGLALCRVQLMSDLVVPNDTATLEFDPAAEFVVQPTTTKDAEGKDVAETGDKETVKVKAFVPDWLRRRLEEATVKPQH